jgi:OFA family oxalate/formate antiporter-like MFS transporter
MQMQVMDKPARGTLAVIFASLAVVWPGALMFGYPGLMGAHWQKAFGVGQGPIGNTLFFMWAAVALFMYPVGRWQRKCGSRLIMFIGTLVCSLSIFAVSFASNIWMVYLWAFLHGIAACSIYNPALTTVQHWYPLRGGLVSGIVNTSFGISAAGIVPLINTMIRSMSYTHVHIMLGLFVLLSGLPAGRFVEVPERLNRFGGAVRREKAMNKRGLSKSLSIRETLRTRNFWLLWLTWALLGAAGTAMITLSTSFGLSKGFTMGSAMVILTAFNLTNGASRLFSGYVSDLLSRNLVMAVSFFASAGAYFLLPHIRVPVLAAMLAGIVGFGFGTLITVSAPLVMDCFGLEHFGAIIGLLFTALGFVSGALGPSLAGYLLDLTEGNFFCVFSYLGVLCVFSGIFPLLMDLKYAKSSSHP